jgi:hypothetical protein
MNALNLKEMYTRSRQPLLFVTLLLLDNFWKLSPVMEVMVVVNFAVKKECMVMCISLYDIPRIKEQNTRNDSFVTNF